MWFCHCSGVCHVYAGAGGRHEGGGQGDGEEDKGKDEFEQREMVRSKTKCRYSDFFLNQKIALVVACV